MPGKEERVRARAYELWESEGRGHGSDERHWLEATRQVEAEISQEGKPTADLPAALVAAKPAAKRVAKPKAAAPAAVPPATKTAKTKTTKAKAAKPS